jgi:hypothetical protein
MTESITRILVTVDFDDHSEQAARVCPPAFVFAS